MIDRAFVALVKAVAYVELTVLVLVAALVLYGFVSTSWA